MPGFDGTGPQGKGPMTGRGEGYCVIKLEPGRTPEGYAGVDNKPFKLEGHPFNLLPGGMFSRLFRTSERKGRDRRVAR